jgi:hypothetical protein
MSIIQTTAKVKIALMVELSLINVELIKTRDPNVSK